MYIYIERVEDGVRRKVGVKCKRMDREGSLLSLPPKGDLSICKIQGLVQGETHLVPLLSSAFDLPHATFSSDCTPAVIE